MLLGFETMTFWIVLCGFSKLVLLGFISPFINAINFKINPSLIWMVQLNEFQGLDSKDYIAHLAMFYELCNTFKMNEALEDVIHLCLFQFPLRDNANSWLNSLTIGSIPT